MSDFVNSILLTNFACMKYLLAFILCISACLCLSADNYSCRFCGSRFSSISSMTANKCSRHPDGAYKGYHSPYQGDNAKKKFFCSYCGSSFTSIGSMTANKCSRHPNGAYKGYHSPYTGSEASKYYCIYCGSSFTSISSMTANKCSRHPNGAYKGYHAPSH